MWERSLSYPSCNFVSVNWMLIQRFKNWFTLCVPRSLYKPNIKALKMSCQFSKTMLNRWLISTLVMKSQKLLKMNILPNLIFTSIHLMLSSSSWTVLYNTAYAWSWTIRKISFLSISWIIFIVGVKRTTYGHCWLTRRVCRKPCTLTMALCWFGRFIFIFDTSLSWRIIQFSQLFSKTILHLNAFHGY